MTRRPLQPRMSRLVRTTHAQTPSAKKASESPTAQLGPTRPPRAAATPPSNTAMHWWKFDEATNSFLDTQGGPSMRKWGFPPPTLQQSPLAPDSTYSVVTDGHIDVWDLTTTPLLPGPDGLITFDFWAAGWPDYLTFNVSYGFPFMVWYNMNTDVGFSILVDYESKSTVDFFWAADYDETATPIMSFSQSELVGTTHIRWENNITAGTSTIYVNGVQKASASGLTATWPATAAGWTPDTWYGYWGMYIGDDWITHSGFKVDELKIYGSPT